MENIQYCGPQALWLPTNGVYVSGEPFVATHTLTMNIQIANCWMHGFFVTNTAQTQSMA